jgi:hypothetical protein
MIRSMRRNLSWQFPALLFLQRKSSSRLGTLSPSPLADLLLTSKSKTLNTSPYGRSAGLNTEDRCLSE